MMQVTTKSSWRWALVLMATGWAAMLVGCAAMPVQEMSDARQAIEAAAQAGGDQKAPQQMQEARAALTQAETALKNVQYKMARHLAQQARAKAIEAQRIEQ